MILLGFILLLIPVYLIFSFCRYYEQKYRDSQSAKQHGCKPVPHYPHKDPILGLDAFFRTLRALRRGHMMDDFHERFDEVGGGVKTYSTVFLGSRVIHTMEPQNTKTILATNFKHYNLTPARKSALAPFGHGIFSSDGAAWEESRAMLRPNFARSLVEDLDSLEHHVSTLIAQIPRTGGTVDLEELFLKLTMDVISALLFGVSTNASSGKADSKTERFCETFNEVSRSLAKHMRIGPLATILPDPEFLKGVKYIKDFISIYVSKAIAIQTSASQEKGDTEAEKQRYTFLRELAVRGYPEDRIRIELLGTLVAGRETTATVLTSLWYTIARCPAIFLQLRREVMEHIGNKRPTIGDLRNLQYLKWTVNESEWHATFGC
jgi:cytochrome P450